MKRKGYTPMDIPILAITIVISAISLSLGAVVLTNLQNQQIVAAGGTAGVNTTISIASNITGYGLSGLNTMGQYLPTIAVVIAAAVVIGILLYSFKFGKGNGE